MVTSDTTITTIMIERKEFMVLDEEGQHEYTIIVDDDGEAKKYSLYTSSGIQWSEEYRNKLQLSIIDNGNGLILNRSIKKLDYSELLHLRLLIDFENNFDSNSQNKFKYRIIEIKSLFEL